MSAGRGESLAAFDERCIPAGGVAPPSNTPGILGRRALPAGRLARLGATPDFHQDRKSTRLNSSHTVISYAVFCLKKKTKKMKHKKQRTQKDRKRTRLIQH